MISDAYELTLPFPTAKVKNWDALKKHAVDMEAVQLFKNPETEPDPMNVCLCPNCAALYRRIRGNTREMDLLRNQFLAIREHDVIGADHVVFKVDGQSRT